MHPPLPLVVDDPVAEVLIDVISVVLGFVVVTLVAQLRTAMLHSGKEKEKPELPAVKVKTAVLTTSLPPG